jgi:dUTP pyrophosphatase
MMLDIELLRNTPMPEYKTKGSAAFDLTNQSGRKITLTGTDIEMIPTGIKIKIPDGYVGLVTPRSGISLYGFQCSNSPGIIDSDYRGEVCVIATLKSSLTYKEIEPGERIAQLLIVRCEQAKFRQVERIEIEPDNRRGEGGFGHTGKV